MTKENEKAWLDRTNEDPQYLKSLLQPHNSNEMKAYEVSKAVGSPKNQGRELIKPV